MFTILEVRVGLGREGDITPSLRSIDAQRVVLTLAVVGLVLAPIALTLLRADLWVAVAIGVVLAALSLQSLVQAVWMVYSSIVAKPKMWAKLLDGAPVAGLSSVLDVGPGRGRFLAMVAARAPDARLVGIDLWRGQDQSRNTREATEQALHDAGIADRLELVTGDMRWMPFEDGEFDLVAATLAVHNVAGDPGRGEAVRELARVTSSNGRILILDFSGIDLYASELRAAGWDPEVSGPIRSMFPWCRSLQASRG